MRDGPAGGPESPMLNLLTDIPGILVGHAQDAALASGVTAIVFDAPAVVSVAVHGGAPGTRETDLLAPHMSAAGADAIVLSGGSAFGLGAADGVQAWLRERGRGFPVGPFRVPLVPQAICFDLMNGGDKAWGTYPPYRELGYLAARDAKPGGFPLGTIGGGYGANTVDLKGGLGSPSARAGTPRPRAINTGRVSKNALGLFSNGATETLEVKLRLVPVPTCQQNEFISSMGTYRELSKIIPADFDPTAWTSFLQNNPGLNELTENLKSSAHCQHTSQQTGVGMETLSQLMQQGMLQRPPSQQMIGPRSPAFSYPVQNEASPYDQVSRTVSPFTPGVNTICYPNGIQAPVNMQVVPSRPASQTSMAGNGPALMSESDPALSRYAEVGSSDMVVLSTEEPAKKRVCTTRTEWSGKPSLGNAAESLRVTASTAASVRTVRPLAARPSVSEAAPLEQPSAPRQPTPRPNAANPRPRRARPSKASSLRRDSAQSLPAASEISPPAAAPAMTEIVVSSCPVEDPRGRSAVASPAEMASSPPVLERPSPAPSSPALPMLPHVIDSGFVSGSADGECETQDNMRFTADEELDAALPQHRPAQPVRVLPLLIQEVTPGPPELLPTTYQPRPMRVVPPLTPAPASQGRKREPNRTAPNEAGEKPEIVAPKPTRPILPNLQCTAGSSLSEPIRPSSAAEMAMPTAGPTMDEPSGLLPSSAPGNVIRSAGAAPVSSPSPSIGTSMSPPILRDGIGPLTRQNSVGPAPAPLAGTAAAAATAATVATGEKPQIRSGSGAKRKRAIENRLNRAINLGQMPPYCDNCGAIETPTWRKAWCKRIFGPEVDRVQISQEDGGVIGIRDVQKDASNKITAMSILKRNLLVTDEGFVVIQLCNRKFFSLSLSLSLSFLSLSHCSLSGVFSIDQHLCVSSLWSLAT